MFRSKNFDIFQIKQIIQLLNDNYNFIIDNCETYNGIKQSSFSQNKYSYNELENLINSNEGEQVVFMRIQAFKVNSQYNIINNYNDYMNSDCDFVLLITDSNYWEVYCKNISLIKNIELLISNCNFYNIEYITDENDTRYSFNLN